MSATEALTRMSAGVPLEFDYVNARTIAITLHVLVNAVGVIAQGKVSRGRGIESRRGRWGGGIGGTHDRIRNRGAAAGK
jgi:hypothetical protein